MGKYVMSDNDLLAIFVTLKLAIVSTAILMLLGAPLAYWMSKTKCRLKPVLEAFIALPLILPPTVLGFYLLVVMGRDGPLGGLLDIAGVGQMVFTFSGLVIGSVIYSLPFVVQPLQNTFSMIGKRPMEVGATLGKSPLESFLTVVLPMAKGGFITAFVLGFAHTIGEFGVVLMIGGNIPGETQVLSVVIYDHVEALDYASAHLLSGGLVLFSLIILSIIYTYNRQAFVVGGNK